MVYMISKYMQYTCVQYVVYMHSKGEFLTISVAWPNRY